MKTFVCVTLFIIMHFMNFLCDDGVCHVTILRKSALFPAIFKNFCHPEKPDCHLGWPYVLQQVKYFACSKV